MIEGLVAAEHLRGYPWYPYDVMKLATRAAVRKSAQRKAALSRFSELLEKSSVKNLKAIDWAG